MKLPNELISEIIRHCDTVDQVINLVKATNYCGGGSNVVYNELRLIAGPTNSLIDKIKLPDIDKAVPRLHCSEDIINRLRYNAGHSVEIVQLYIEDISPLSLADKILLKTKLSKACQQMLVFEKRVINLLQFLMADSKYIDHIQKNLRRRPVKHPDIIDHGDFRQENFEDSCSKDYDVEGMLEIYGFCVAHICNLFNKLFFKMGRQSTGRFRMNDSIIPTLRTVECDIIFGCISYLNTEFVRYSIECRPSPDKLKRLPHTF